jgi:FlaA1/EpsC-like NDP-sugar epimerase
MGLYRRVWRYISIQDGIHLARSVGIVSLDHAARSACILANQIRILTVPISIVIMDFMLTVAGMIVARLSWRITVENASRVRRSADGGRSCERCSSVLVMPASPPCARSYAAREILD